MRPCADVEGPRTNPLHKGGEIQGDDGFFYSYEVGDVDWDSVDGEELEPNDWVYFKYKLSNWLSDEENYWFAYDVVVANNEKDE